MKKHLFQALIATSAIFASLSSMASDSQTILTCHETSGNVLVTENAKQMTIDQDSSGQLTMTVIQNDAAETRTLMAASPVEEVSCNGYQPCRRFSSETVQFFINFYSHLTYQPGHLEATVNGQKLAAYFHCTQN